MLLVPFVITALLFYRNIKNIKNWIFPVSILVIIFTTLFIQLTSLTAQKSSITIFKDENLTLKKAEYYDSFTPPLRSLLGNQYVFYSIEIGKRFFASFSPTFLVTQGGSHPWHTLPGWGNIILPVYIFSFIGILNLIFNCVEVFQKKSKRTNSLSTLSFIFKQYRYQLLLLYLLIASLAPSAITVDSPHTTRSLLFLFIFCLFSVYGVQWSIRILKLRTVYIKIALVSLSVCYGVTSFIYIYQYKVLYPPIHPKLFNSKFIKTIQDVDTKYSNKRVAVVDPSGYMYILAAWYLKVDSETFFNTIKKQQPDSIGFRYGEQLKNYHFIADKKDVTNLGENVLVYMNTDTGEWIIQTL